jgi:hypothetical protein
MTKTNGNSCTDTPTEPRPSSEIYYAKLRPVWNPPEVARGTSRIKKPLRSGPLAVLLMRSGANPNNRNRHWQSDPYGAAAGESGPRGLSGAGRRSKRIHASF